MKLYSEYASDINSYDTNPDRIADSIFQILNTESDKNIETKNEDSRNNKYNAVHIMKTGRKAASHTANRIPFGVGSTKIVLEALAGRTAGREKLSNTQRKLYGLGAGLSMIGRGLTWLGVYTGNLWFTGPLPFLSIMSSAIFAAAQASVIGGETNVGKIFEAKMSEYLQTIKNNIAKLRNKKVDEPTQVQINIIENNIEEVENIIHSTSNQELTAMVKEIVVDLPEMKHDEK